MVLSKKLNVQHSNFVTMPMTMHSMYVKEPKQQTLKRRRLDESIIQWPYKD
jgi:hypothetical protein